jgi:hypothetical protein
MRWGVPPRDASIANLRTYEVEIGTMKRGTISLIGVKSP